MNTLTVANKRDKVKTLKATMVKKNKSISAKILTEPIKIIRARCVWRKCNDMAELTDEISEASSCSDVHIKEIDSYSSVNLDFEDPSLPQLQSVMKKVNRFCEDLTESAFGYESETTDDKKKHKRHRRHQSLPNKQTQQNHRRHHSESSLFDDQHRTETQPTSQRKPTKERENRLALLAMPETKTSRIRRRLSESLKSVKQGLVKLCKEKKGLEEMNGLSAPSMSCILVGS